MIVTPSRKGPVHQRPIGFIRWINGERCMLLRYTIAGNQQYRRPNGLSFTIHTAKARRKYER